MTDRSVRVTHLSKLLRLIVGVSLLLASCGGDAATDPDAAPSESSTLTVYTSVTQDTVDAVVEAFEDANPGVDVTVFRAPTGELTARIAAEGREGGIGADIFWLTDPLSIQQYSDDGLLREWIPTEADSVPDQYRSATFIGTRILNLVIVVSTDLASLPDDWDDLALIDGTVAIPDPGFAGSAFGALAFFSSSPDFGIAYYEALKDNGAVQVRSPGDVVTGVAEGIYVAGISLDRTVNSAVEDGSPVALVWPASGAIAVYSPIAVLDETESPWAEPFVDFVISVEAQRLIASTGWQPVRPEVDWPDRGNQLSVEWPAAFSKQEELLVDYNAVFGG